MKRILQYTLIVLLSVGIIACSDNGSGTEVDEDPPSVPDIAAQTQPDISFFETNTGSESADISLPEFFGSAGNNLIDGYLKSSLSDGNISAMDAYNAASINVLNSAVLAGFFPMFTTFVNEASGEDPSFNDGVWEWTYSVTEEGVSGSFRLTAETGDNATEWNLFLSFDDGETSVENANILAGTVQNDGNSGSWEFRFPVENSDSAVLLFSSEWEIISDTESNILFNVYDGEGGTTPVADIAFGTEEPEHFMTINNFESGSAEVDVEVFWNTETSIGYIFVAGGDPPKQCWDSSLQDIACSDVGL